MMPKKLPMPLSIAELEKFSARQGGKVVNESSGCMRVYQLESPAGMVWSASSTHCLRVEWREKDWKGRNEAVKDAIERMSHGVRACDNYDCDYCHKEKHH